MKRPVPSRALASALLVAAFGATAAEPPSAGQRIYRCVDAKGNKHVSQTPIPECVDRDQQQLNADGSVRAVIRKPLTEKEREAEEIRVREAEAACRKRKIDERADRNLVTRFPDRPKHELARQDAINSIAKAMRISQTRIELLLRDKKRLDDEREFYPSGTELPTKLKLAIDRNDSALEAQNKLATQQLDELQRINKRFDEELEHLQKLWRSPPAPLGC